MKFKFEPPKIPDDRAAKMQADMQRAMLRYLREAARVPEREFRKGALRASIQATGESQKAWEDKIRALRTSQDASWRLIAERYFAQSWWRQWWIARAVMYLRFRLRGRQN